MESLEYVTMLKAGLVQPWTIAELDSMPAIFVDRTVYVWNLVTELRSGGAAPTKAESMESELAGLSKGL